MGWASWYLEGACNSMCSPIDEGLYQGPCGIIGCTAAYVSVWAHASQGPRHMSGAGGPWAGWTAHGKASKWGRADAARRQVWQGGRKAHQHCTHLTFSGIRMKILESCDRHRSTDRLIIYSWYIWFFLAGRLQGPFGTFPAPPARNCWFRWDACSLVELLTLLTHNAYS